MENRIDVVIFGASGFTGQYAVKELYKLTKDKPLSLTWAISGRSKDKLETVLEDLKQTTGDESMKPIKIITADVNDEVSLKNMTKQAKVIANCCGPYQLYGEQVIKACIATGTHHVDLSGETQFTEGMQLKYQKVAQDCGVYIISGCGYGSVPPDLGIVDLQNKFNGTINTVEIFYDIQIDDKYTGPHFPRFNYGTWESIIWALANKDEIGSLRRKLYPEPLPEFKPKIENLQLYNRNPFVNKPWIIPFTSADECVLMRSQRYFYEEQNKRPVQFRAYFAVPSFIGVIYMGLFALIVSVMTKFKCGQDLLLKHPKFFSLRLCTKEGPTKEFLDHTRFSTTLIAKGWSSDKTFSENTDQFADPPNKTMVTRVSGRDPSYGGTCLMLLLCAITIVKESDKIPNKGGVITPAAAFAKTSLIQELNKNDIKFELISSKEDI